MSDFAKFLKENHLSCGYLCKGKCCASPHAEYADTPCDGDCTYARGLQDKFLEWKEKEEEITKELMEFIPKDDLTEEEFNEANRIWETSRLSFDVVKYIRSVHPEEGSKWAKGYFDLYIDDRHYEKV